MASDTPNEDEFPPTEGVRIIGATEAGAQGAIAGSSFPIDFSGIPDIDHESDGPESVSLPLVQPEESFELPHYSDPPTGQVPKVVIGDESDAQWSALADQPRWRDTDSQFDEQTDFTDLVDEDGPKLGALDADRTADPFAFDDLGDLTDDATTTVKGATTGPIPIVTHDSDEPLVRQPPTPRRKRGDAGATGSTSASAPGGGRNLPVAIAAGVGLVGIGALAFYAGSLATTALIAVILTLAAIEYFTAVRDAGFRPASIIGIVATLGLSIAPLYRGFQAYPIILGLATLAGLMWFLFVQPGEGATMNLGVTLLGVMWVGGLGSFATLTLGVARPFEAKTSNQGLGILIAAVMVTVLYDVGAYFSGRSLGKTPLSKASPNKTQEGLLGGFVVSLVASILVLWLGELHPVGPAFGKVVVFTLLCALAAPIGDLCQSAIKRDLGIKDMGTLIPGHGGVLDRFDGLLFVLPVAYFAAHLLGLGEFAKVAIF